MDRVALFIDGAYFAYGLKAEFEEPRLDFALLANALAGSKEILRTYYYHCLPYQSDPPTTQEATRFGRMQSFVDQLNRLPRFQIRLGKLALRGIRADGERIFVQKRVDIMLGVDLVLLSAKGQISNAVLLAGDSDFLPAVEVARNEGVLVHLYHFTKNPPHRELWDACDERTPITQTLIDRVRRP
jgi:uncharacterized LabA/DUF88 family protein